MNFLLLTASRELQGYQTSKGTIRSPTDKPPSSRAREKALVKKMAKIRIAGNREKQAARGRNLPD